MKKKFTIYDSTLSGSPETGMVNDIEREVLHQQGLVLQAFTDWNTPPNSPREQLTAMFEYHERVAVDGIAVYSLARLADTVPKLTRLLLDIEARGLELLCVQEGIYTGFAKQRFLFSVVRTLQDINITAQSHAIKRGLEKARAKGVSLGRPGTRLENVNTAFLHIWDREFEPVEIPLEPWQIQKKAKISSGLYYSLLDGLRILVNGGDVAAVCDGTNLGIQTARNLETCYAAAQESK